MASVTLATVPYVDAALASVEGGALAISTVEIDFGVEPQTSGMFTIAGAGMTVGKPVVVRQAIGPYTGKGTMPDEAVMDRVDVAASVTSPTAITAFWTSATLVAGNFKFDYFIGG